MHSIRSRRSRRPLIVIAALAAAYVFGVILSMVARSRRGGIGTVNRLEHGTAVATRTEAVKGATTRARSIVAVAIAALVATLVLAIEASLRRNEQQQSIAVRLTGGDPGRAPVALRRYGCAGCHTIPELPGAAGKVGPSLSGLSQRLYIGGVLRQTPANLIAWIENPRAFSERTSMPVTGITHEEARDVAAYLLSH